MSLGAVSLTSSFTAIRGHIHPYTSRRLFHSSWLSPSHRHISRPGKLVESGGMNIGAVPQGTAPVFSWGGDDRDHNTTWTAWYESVWGW